MEERKTSPFDCILIDLDDTLYPSSAGIAAAMRKNIEEFLANRLGVSADEACRLRSELFRSHGSSLAGLRAMGHNVHPDEYHGFVHGRLPYDNIHPDPFLANTLRGIPVTKILFTNSDRAHARRALARLGVDERVFARIICFETLNTHLFNTASSSSLSQPVVLKPSASAFHTAIRIAGCEPRRTLFLDDSERNIATAKSLGIRTALVGRKAIKPDTADYLVESVASLRLAVPEIWTPPAVVDVQKRGTTRKADVETQSMVAAVEA